MNIHYFDCTCHDFNHTFRFVHDPADSAEIWLEVQMVQWRPWYQRIATAIGYIFNRHTVYGHYDVAIIRQEDIPRLIGLLQNAQVSADEECCVIRGADADRILEDLKNVASPEEIARRRELNSAELDEMLRRK